MQELTAYGGVQDFEDVTTTSIADFDHFYDAQYPALVQLGFALTGSRWVAEELTQETMLRALQRWATVSTYARPDAWVRRVLLNLATSRGRRLAVEARALIKTHKPPQPEMTAEGAALWDAVRRLPKRDAHVIALRYIEDMTIAEMAAVLDRPEGSVKSSLHRARGLLAAALQEDDE